MCDLFLLVGPYVLVKYMLRRAVTVVVTDSMEKNLFHQQPFKVINFPCFIFLPIRPRLCPVS